MPMLKRLSTVLPANVWRTSDKISHSGHAMVGLRRFWPFWNSLMRSVPFAPSVPIQKKGLLPGLERIACDMPARPAGPVQLSLSSVPAYTAVMLIPLRIGESNPSSSSS